MGSKGGMEIELITREGIPFTSIPAAGLHGVGIRALPGNLKQLYQGYKSSSKILNQYQPDVLFYTGGYMAVPMILASRYSFKQKSANALFVPDIEPGLALKFAARFADRIVVTTEDSKAYFPTSNNIAVCGYPVRDGLLEWSKEDAFAAFDLKPETPVLLIFGGSKGARSINRALIAGLEQLLPHTQILHISGNLDWDEVKAASEALPKSLKSHYRPYPYLHEKMGAAFTVANLIIARAGASTLGELPAFGLPAILVPYPHAWRYQQVNAEYLASRGAAIILSDEDLNSKLVSTIFELLNDPNRCASMHNNMLSLSNPESANNIAEDLLQLAETNDLEREQ